MGRVFAASWQRPDPGLLQPGDGIILYASRTPAKCPTAEECAAYRARGVVVRFVFEDAADRATVKGYAEGVADGALTLAQVKARGGQRGDVVYFACDVAAALNLDYARGFRSGLTSFFEPGCYAGDRNLERARVSLGFTKLWQAGASSWSDHWDPDAHHGAYAYAVLYQVAGASPIPGTDLNVINRSDWGGSRTSMGDPDDMANLPYVIFDHDDPTRAAIVHGDKAVPIQTTGTVSMVKAAGCVTVPLPPDEYDRTVTELS